MTSIPSNPRVAAAVAAIALEALLGLALLIGLTVRPVPHVERALRPFDIAPPPVTRPPPPRPPHRARAAAPPGRRARPTPVVIPLPVIALAAPPAIVAAPLPLIGVEAAVGAAAAGSGQGSGGTGSGSGGGGTPARWLRGRIRDADYPRAARDAGIGGDLTTRYVVDTRGRVTDCTVLRPSGTAELDETTCRLVEERFRYAPRRDAVGRAVPDVVVESRHWVMEPPQP